MIDYVRLFRAVCVGGLLCFLGGQPVAWAHAPSQIDIELISATKTINIKVGHRIRGAHYRHFVKKIEVWLNDSKVKTIDFNEQGDPAYYQQNSRFQEGKVTLLGLKKGDKISVKAYCSLYGSYETKTTV